MSGGVDIRPFPNNWDIAERLGPLEENKKVWEENSVINLTYLLNGKDLQLIFDCGVDDFFFGINKNLHEKLIGEKVPHDYIERPGGHTANYWENSLKYQLVFFNDFFKEVASN
jgi:enterochelin esterase-like enzyme